MTGNKANTSAASEEKGSPSNKGIAGGNPAGGAEELSDQEASMGRKRKEIIDYAIMMEYLGVYVDWIKVAERLEKLQEACPECGRKNLRA